MLRFLCFTLHMKCSEEFSTRFYSDLEQNNINRLRREDNHGCPSDSWSVELFTYCGQE